MQADVAALRAENERMRRDNERFVRIIDSGEWGRGRVAELVQAGQVLQQEREQLRKLMGHLRSDYEAVERAKVAQAEELAAVKERMKKKGAANNKMLVKVRGDRRARAWRALPDPLRAYPCAGWVLVQCAGARDEAAGCGHQHGREGPQPDVRDRQSVDEQGAGVPGRGAGRAGALQCAALGRICAADLSGAVPAAGRGGRAHQRCAQRPCCEAVAGRSGVCGLRGDLLLNSAGSGKIKAGPPGTAQDVAQALYSLSPGDVETLQHALQQDGGLPPARPPSSGLGPGSQRQLPPRPRT